MMVMIWQLAAQVTLPVSSRFRAACAVLDAVWAALRAERAPSCARTVHAGLGGCLCCNVCCSRCVPGSGRQLLPILVSSMLTFLVML
eukprot:812696-Rhodomonas_salina.1